MNFNERRRIVDTTWGAVEIETVTCAQCGIEQADFGLVNWIETRPKLYTDRMGDRPTEGDFCCMRCLVDYFSRKREAETAGS